MYKALQTDDLGEDGLYRCQLNRGERFLYFYHRMHPKVWYSFRRCGPALGIVMGVYLLGALSSHASPVGGEKTFSAGQRFRQAIELRDAGDHYQASAQLRELSSDHAVIADYADWYQLTLWRELGRHDDARALAIQAAQQHRKSRLYTRFEEALGELHSRANNSLAAQQAWQRALAAKPTKYVRLNLKHRLAASLRQQEPERAAALYRDLWINEPTDSRDAQVAKTLDELEKNKVVTKRNATSYRKRGERLLSRGNAAGAYGAFQVALERLPKNSAQAKRVGLRLAHSLFRMRRYSEAVSAFGAYPNNVEARLYRARSLARSGQEAKAVAALRKLAKANRNRTGVYARYLAALLLDEPSTRDQARSLFRAVAEVSAYPDLANGSIWRLGWGAYQEGRLQEAQRYFALLLERDRDPIGRLRPRYWLARSREHEASSASQSEFAAIATHFPLSYYGWRSAQRVQAESVWFPRKSPPKPVSQGSTQLNLPRVRILLEAGLLQDARDELLYIIGKERKYDRKIALARWLHELNAFDRSSAVAMGVGNVRLAQGPVPQNEELWWLAWPKAYAQTTEYPIAHPELVYAVMREESRFRAAVVSPVGARGLMQIMPKTGERLAAAMQLPSYQHDDLFRPEINLRMGSFYLNRLLQRFNGRMSAAIAAYNAGPERVERWLAARGNLSDDMWVETIPFRETRRYVRRVLRSVHAYRMLY